MVNPSTKEEKLQILKDNLESITLGSFNGSEVRLHVPTTRREIDEAWGILKRYTRKMAPNPESTLQDLDEIEHVKSYHFDPDFWYAVITAVDRRGNPIAMLTADAVSLSDYVRGDAKGKGVGFIYQAAVAPGVSSNYRDLRLMTEMYKAVAGKLQKIGGYKKDKWLGVVTERHTGDERKAIGKARFGVVVPNGVYLPPAVQKTKDPKNKYTRDMELLGHGVPRDLRHQAARTYVRAAYPQKYQPKDYTLRRIREHFAQPQLTRC